MILKIKMYISVTFICLLIVSCGGNKQCCNAIVDIYSDYSGLRASYLLMRPIIIDKHNNGNVNETIWRALVDTDKQLRETDEKIDEIYKDALYNKGHIFTEEELAVVRRGFNSIIRLITIVTPLII
jgi:hypothetical protein